VSTEPQRRGRGFPVKLCALQFLLPPQGMLGDGRWETMLQPQTIFRPHGLLVWGFELSTMIDGLYVGVDPQLAAPAPAHLFACPVDFEVFTAFGSPRPELSSPQGWFMLDLPERPPTAVEIDSYMATANVGTQLRLSVTGRLHRAVLWGPYVE